MYIAYNKHTGHFTAPRDGTYYFATSFLNVSKTTHLQLMKNDEDVGRGTSYPDHASTGSINVIIWHKTILFFSENILL
jgi:hypothetical protein